MEWTGFYKISNLVFGWKLYCNGFSRQLRGIERDPVRGVQGFTRVETRETALLT